MSIYTLAILQVYREVPRFFCNTNRYINETKHESNSKLLVEVLQKRGDILVCWCIFPSMIS